MTSPITSAIAPDLDAIAQLVSKAISGLPAAYKVMATAVAVNIMEFAPEDLLAEIGVMDPFEFTGLYTGIPLPEKSEDDPTSATDTIWIFRRPILDEWAMRGDVSIAQMVTHVTINELSHHFGWTPEEITKIDADWSWDAPQDND